MVDRELVREALTGPGASLRTPFNQDGSIDFAGLRNMIDFDLAAGSKAIVLTAGDSHYMALSEAEIAEVTRVTVEHTNRRALVVAADRYYHTQQAVEFARFAAETGADILMVLPPDWGHSTTPETLTQHYGAVAEHIPIMLVTNIFIPRGLDFAMRSLQMILERVNGVVAIKDDFCGEFGRKMGLLVHEHWAVWTGGQKENHMDALPYGCDGYLSTFITFKPEIAHRYWQAVEANEIRTAAVVIRDYDMPLFDFIGKMQGGFDAAMHGVLELYGISRRWRRKPYYSLNDEEMEILSSFLKDLGVL